VCLFVFVLCLFVCLCFCVFVDYLLRAQRSNTLQEVLVFCVRPEYRMQRGGQAPSSDKLIRIAIVNEDKCKPKKCAQECKKSCPVVRMGVYTAAL
jgi:Possible Fer4-like domain in RNase L inhibitor, RLI